MRESRTYGSGRGACHEMHVPTATGGASSSRYSAALRRRGRSRRAHSRAARLIASVSFASGHLHPALSNPFVAH